MGRTFISVRLITTGGAIPTKTYVIFRWWTHMGVHTGADIQFQHVQNLFLVCFRVHFQCQTTAFVFFTTLKPRSNSCCFSWTHFPGPKNGWCWLKKQKLKPRSKSCRISLSRSIFQCQRRRCFLSNSWNRSPKVVVFHMLRANFPGSENDCGFEKNWNRCLPFLLKQRL